MADSVNRIVSLPLAQERYSISRREREKKEGQERKEQDTSSAASSSVPDAQTNSPGDNDQLKKSAPEKTKGKILDVNV